MAKDSKDSTPWYKKDAPYVNRPWWQVLLAAPFAYYGAKWGYKKLKKHM